MNKLLLILLVVASPLLSQAEDCFNIKEVLGANYIDEGYGAYMVLERTLDGEIFEVRQQSIEDFNALVVMFNEIVNLTGSHLKYEEIPSDTEFSLEHANNLNGELVVDGEEDLLICTYNYTIRFKNNTKSLRFQEYRILNK